MNVVPVRVRHADATATLIVLVAAKRQRGNLVQDYSAVGLASHAEAEKSLHRAIAFAVLLVLAHLLDIRPSEFDALGLKIVMTDAIILYGLLAMLFGFYLSKFMSQSERGMSLFPLTVERRRVRANLRLAYRSHITQKTGRQNPLTPKRLKRQAWWFITIGNIILLPYRLVSTGFVLGGIVFAAVDMYKLGAFILGHSRLVGELGNTFS